MKKTVMSSLKRAFLDQSGQAVVWITAGMIAIMGLAGLTADVGHTFVVKAQLQNGANAAAVAAAAQVYSTGSGLTDAAQQYDSLNGGANYLSFATSMTATPICLNSLLPGGTAHPQCVTSSTNPLANCGYTICNAVRVTQTASVPTTFLRVLNVNSLSVGVSALAAMGGPIVTPPGGTTGPDQNTWNIAIIEDATGSMATTDSNCTGSPSEFVCAVNAMQTILANLNPCPTGISPCTQASAKTRVALFSFPNMVTSEIPKFYAAGCSPDLSSYTTPMPYQVYTLPKENLTSYTPLSYTPAGGGATWTASYEFTPINTLDGDANGFVSDYYQVGNTATGGLNPASTLVRLVGYNPNGSGGTATATPCLPIAPAGIALNGATGSGSNNSIVNTVKVGEGITYYAAVIYAAQAALTAEATAYPGSSNAIIFLSDGQANLQWIYFPPGGLKQTPSANTQAVNTITDATKGYSALNTAINHGAKVASGLSSPNQEGTAPISGVYPDFFDECQQAIAAAQYAANVGPKAPNVAGTGGAGQASRVYSIAYGSEQTGCGSGPVDNHNDVTLVSLGTLNQSFSSVSALSPCVTMENIASDLDWFFSDYMQSGSNVSTTCIDNAHPVSSMMGIGEAIAASFTNARLLPAGTT